MIEKQPFDFTVQRYTEAKLLEVPHNCNSFTVINVSPVGGAIITVNQMPLNPRLVAGATGENFGMGGNLGEILWKREIEVTVGAGTAAYIVIFKFYICK